MIVLPTGRYAVSEAGLPLVFALAGLASACAGFNVGSSDVRWQFGVQAITIPPGHRVVFFLTPPATPYADQLLTEGARAAIEDGIMVVKATNEVGVSWSGARFQLPAGSELRLDPLQGQPFSKALPARAAQ